MVEWLETFEPTYYSGAPAIHRALLDELARRDAVPRFALRFILSASAALPAELAARLAERLGVPLLQGYGMTEAGVVAQNPLPPGVSRAGSVGLPAANEFAILGDAGTLLPPGETGEIVVRGPEVFDGYESDPAANRRAFHRRLVQDGRSRLRRCRRLSFHRRARERAHQSRRLQGVARPRWMRRSCGIPKSRMRPPSRCRTQRSARTWSPPSSSASRALRRPRRCAISRSPNLASFMVPSQIVLDAGLPRSVTGKLQRAAIATLMRTRLRPPFTSPRDSREEEIAGLFAEVLGVGPVGAFDNFFELGGDSLRGAQLVSRFNAADAVESRSGESLQAADGRGIRGRAHEHFRGIDRGTPADCADAARALSPGRCRHEDGGLIDAGLRRDRPRDRTRARAGRGCAEPAVPRRGRSSSSFLRLRAATAT